MILVNSKSYALNKTIPLKLEIYLDTEWNYKAFDLDPCKVFNFYIF